jgi:hypothetical protein
MRMQPCEAEYPIEAASGARILTYGAEMPIQRVPSGFSTRRNRIRVRGPRRGRYHHGFRCMVVISKSPVGVGYDGCPVAIPNLPRASPSRQEEPIRVSEGPRSTARRLRSVPSGVRRRRAHRFPTCVESAIPGRARLQPLEAPAASFDEPGSDTPECDAGIHRHAIQPLGKASDVAPESRSRHIDVEGYRRAGTRTARSPDRFLDLRAGTQVLRSDPDPTLGAHDEDQRTRERPLHELRCAARRHPAKSFDRHPMPDERRSWAGAGGGPRRTRGGGLAGGGSRGGLVMVDPAVARGCVRRDEDAPQPDANLSSRKAAIAGADGEHPVSRFRRDHPGLFTTTVIPCRGDGDVRGSHRPGDDGTGACARRTVGRATRT